MYDYLPGEQAPNAYTGANKTETLRVFVMQLVNHYRPVAELAEVVRREGAAGEALLPWLRAPHDHTWEHELRRVVGNARRRFGDFLPPTADDLVLGLAERSLENTDPQRLVLLHGDPGPHNFLFQGPTLTGVIDPGIHVGARIYDLARAFFAWPTDMTPEAFGRAAEALAGYSASSHQQLAEEALPLLYGQTVACLWHHPEDLAAYQVAWAQWSSLIA